MPLEIAVLQQPRDDILLEGGHSAGVKAQALVKLPYQLLWQHHIAHTQRGGNGFGKGVEIDYVVLPGKRKKRFLGLCGNRKLGFKVVLYDISFSLG